MLYRSVGLKIGPDADNLRDVQFRLGTDSNAVALFSGTKSELITMPYDMENEIYWRQSKPLPCMVLAVLPQMVTQDR